VGSLDSLLVLQDIDTALDQLRHRHRTLPERAALEEARVAQASLDAAVEAAFARLHEVRSAQKAAEDEAATVADKATEVERMLYGGTITAAKELEAYQADLAMLKQRQSNLEEDALERMEEAEPLEDELRRLRAEAEASASAVAGADAALDAAMAEVDAEITEVESRRPEALEPLAPEVVEQYVMLRRSLGGVGAARLSGARCEGCHLEIPSAELERLRRAPEDAVVNCPECARILVR